MGLVEVGALTPCRAVDLGCGTGANAIFLAQYGFEVTGVDFATAGIEKASRAAADAGLSVNFVVDDMTDLQRTRGPFDFLLKGERPTTSSSREVAAARTLKLIDTVACPVPTPFLSPSEKRVAREASRSRDPRSRTRCGPGGRLTTPTLSTGPMRLHLSIRSLNTELFRLSAWRTVPSANSPKSRKSIQRRS